MLEGSALVKAVTALQQAIDAGDLAQAQALYIPAREAYQRLAPASQRLAELDNAINARADYFEKREQDPAFSGFHRIEYSLFQQRSLDGLAPIAQRLLTDVTALKQQLLAQSLPPEQLVSIVVRNLNSLADVRAASGEEERYSHIDVTRRCAIGARPSRLCCWNRLYSRRWKPLNAGSCSRFSK